VIERHHRRFWCKYGEVALEPRQLRTVDMPVVAHVIDVDELTPDDVVARVMEMLG
jgi:hypothetical protein